ncbi:hypothetical protein [Burkholderia latens]|uniref:Uncharacterized protein n=1 Tax=Burkholderia latens TaxID=488446 RepID=A0A6H9TIP9_9BURK|nr:hypothetical protein [Burkholderia latens]KAB0643624.1 hypothetical protein F7R21_06300 [Burkholderia latens]VWB74148.1 hypothetical protein BLA24064_03478 [Burkholderia latens]
MADMRPSSAARNAFEMNIHDDATHRRRCTTGSNRRNERWSGLKRPEKGARIAMRPADRRRPPHKAHALMHTHVASKELDGSAYTA